MAPKNTPSEFGGRPQRNEVQPRPHRPTSSEALSLTYRSGDPTGRTEVDNGEAFSGLLPKKLQEAARKQAGDLDKGQVWDELVQKGNED